VSVAPLTVRLRDGRAATLSLLTQATVVTVDDEDVSSYDLCGRPYVLVRGGSTWRRALDGRLLEKRPRAGLAASRLRRLVDAAEGAQTLTAARGDAQKMLEAGVPAEARQRLERIVAMDGPALAADAARFAAVYRRVGILPPDQYLAVVLEATEGCSWNACTFCDFYRSVSFRVKTEAELAAHTAAVRDYFGESLALRRGLFLGSANALCIGDERLVALLEVATAAFPVVPPTLGPLERQQWLGRTFGGVSGVHAFVDAWSGRRRSRRVLEPCRRLGLKRVYIGLESGDPTLLAWLHKPGTPADAVELVSSLHAAGIDVGVIVLLGAGGRRFAAEHVRRTAQVLGRMRLGGQDLLYFSELQGHPELEPLGPEACDAQRAAILEELGCLSGQGRPRVATYDIREFLY
jgi:radical SAM superfamily enzyme YgiQ (UPF0313 family)